MNGDWKYILWIKFFISNCLQFFSNCNWIFQNMMNSALRYCTNKNIANVNCSMISLHLFFLMMFFSSLLRCIERNRRWRTCFYCKITALNRLFDKKKWATFEVYIKRNRSMPFFIFKKIEIAYYIKRNVFL